MKLHSLSALVFLALGAVIASATTYQWTNSLGGSWHVSANWSPNGLPGSSANDLAFITNSGSYTVILTNSIVIASLTLGGSGTPALVVGNFSLLNVTNNANILNGAVLMATNGSLAGVLTVQAGAQLQFVGTAINGIAALNLTNLGTVLWNGGTIQCGGEPATTIYNTGLWLATGNNSIYNGGGSFLTLPVFNNGGIIRKTAGTGLTYFNDFNFINQPGGLVDVLSGTFYLDGVQTNQLSGSFNSTAPGTFSIYNGIWTDAGGIFSGTGTNQFVGGTLNLRTNITPALKLTGGNIYIIGTNTFQSGGAITNLTLDGATLLGSNTVNNGTLTMNSGSLPSQLTILPAGHFVLATPSTKYLYNATLINQGMVTWVDGSVNTGGTVISNGGLWLIENTNNVAMSYGGNAIPVWTNSGTLRKSAGTGVAQLVTMYFYNQSNGIVESDIGTLQLPAAMTNTAGTLRLNGGTLYASGPLAVTGGTLDGMGTFGMNAFMGGIISPGQNGAGLISFPAGLNLSTNTTLFIGGTGTVPGISYGQLSVGGAVSLGNCNLQITSLPVVPAGTTLIIITNIGFNPVIGTFNGLPENSLFNIGVQPFRIHYAGGSGKDVTLVRDASPPLLLGTSPLTNGNWKFTGAGTPSGIYTIQATTNFLIWTNLGFATGDISGNLSFTDTNAFRFRYRFYRTTN